MTDISEKPRVTCASHIIARKLHSGETKYYLRFRTSHDESWRQRALDTSDFDQAKKLQRDFEAAFRLELLKEAELPEPLSRLSVAELCDLYEKRGERYYLQGNGELSSQHAVVRASLRTLRDLYGDVLIAEFTPRLLRAVRDAMLAGEKNLSRRTVNRYVNEIRAAWRWAVEEELVRAEVLWALQAVKHLAPNRTAARETAPVRPVPEASIKAVRKLVPAPVRTLIDLQLATAARPGELVGLRKSDIDTSGKVWTVKLSQHKTAWRGKERVLFLGPKAKKILRPLMLRPGDAYLFDPNVERAAPKDKRRREGQPRNKRKTARKVGECYNTSAYRKAVQRACQAAGVDVWSPNQLRHTAATKIRKKFGLEAAQVYLGHAHADVTQVYAEADEAMARKIAEEMG